jgi:hypothetical protein
MQQLPTRQFESMIQICLGVEAQLWPMLLPAFETYALLARVCLSRLPAGYASISALSPETWTIAALPEFILEDLAELVAVCTMYHPQLFMSLLEAEESARQLRDVFHLLVYMIDAPLLVLVLF